MRCVNCGLPLREGDARCPQCGGAASRARRPSPPSDTFRTPPSIPVPRAATRPSRVGPPALVVGLVLIVAIVALGITFAVKKHSAAAAPANDLAPAPISTAALLPSVPTIPSQGDSAEPAPASSEPEPPPDEASAKTDLDNEVDGDRNAAETLVGHWVPQLSSKRPGLVADGITYDYLHIWADFQQSRTEYPTALLIWSGNYVSFKSPSFYVTVVPQPFPDGVSANDWCDDAGLAPDDCYAKLLSHEGGSSGTTLLRR